MAKETQILPSLDDEKDDSKSRFLLLSMKIPSDVLFSLCLPFFLHNHAWSNKDTTATIAQKLVVEQHDDRYFSNISCTAFSEFFDSFYQDADVMKICKETYSSQISKAGSNLKNALDTFFRNVSNRVYESSNNEEMRILRIKRMFDENESYKAEIASLMNDMQKMMIDYEEKVQEYETEKKHFDKKVKNAYHEANLNTTRTEGKKKHDMLVYLKHFENGLDELETIMEEKQKKFTTAKEANIVTTEQLNKELLKRMTLLKMINNRYSTDMLTRHKKRESFQHYIESKTESVETLKEKIASMETYLYELQEDERVYLKRELYDKLDAIKEKIALRAISKLLIPYVNLKFGPRKPTSRRKKKKNKK